jgi:cysteine-S-conjugate beta-lyase
MFDFDRVIERRGTHASKWDNMARLSGITAGDAIPMWVADMDFAAPPGVSEALLAETRRGVHGYYADTGSWAAALVAWLSRRHHMSVDPAWVSPTPGIVAGLGLILQAASVPGDEVVVFCSPHNPGGTVWTVDEIRALADFCAEHDLLLVSDEIHGDLVFAGAKHTPTMLAAPHIAERLITCVAATKTFNLAGAHVGACITSNAELKRRLDARIMASGLGSYNRFGMLATEAAWRSGDQWLDQLLGYLSESRELFDCRIEAAVPGARSMRLAATYLAWVDFAGTGLPPDEVAHRVKGRARIFASPGPQFGPGGETWMRFNFATPRSVLEEALGRLEEAFGDLRSART